MNKTMSYYQLTLEQAEQVANTFSQYTNPGQFFYRVDTKTGVVMGRFAREPQPVRP